MRSLTGLTTTASPRDRTKCSATRHAWHTAAAGSVAGLEETSLRALTKLQQMLPSRLRRTVIAHSRSATAAPATTTELAPGPSGLVAALRKLPARQREVLVLHYFADLTEAEIAAATGIGAGAVHSHIALAFSLLRAELPAVA